MSIIRIPTEFVKPLFRSGLFWTAILVLFLIFWLSKWKVSKAKEILRLLIKFVVGLVSLFLALFGIQVKKMFDEVGL